MSGKSKKSSQADPARPFDPDIATQAKRIADEYEIVLWFEDGQWFGHSLELPNTYGDGKTPAACIKSVRAGLAATVATMLEEGDTPPAAAREGVRTEQINIRLTAAEKARLENRSRAGGFRGISDFVRTVALADDQR
jgi:predicted RNase H-like HicB family nuclease